MTAKRLGVLLALLHAGILVGFLVYIHSDAAERSQSALYWLAWFPVDLPWSFLNFLPQWVTPVGVEAVLGIPLYSLAEYWHVFVHGVIGTAWWYFLPRIVATFMRRWRLRAN